MLSYLGAARQSVCTTLAYYYLPRKLEQSSVYKKGFFRFCIFSTFSTKPPPPPPTNPLNHFRFPSPSSRVLSKKKPMESAGMKETPGFLLGGGGACLPGVSMTLRTMGSFLKIKGSWTHFLRVMETLGTRRFFCLTTPSPNKNRVCCSVHPAGAVVHELH